MANIFPIAVSGQISPSQETILMTVVNSSPYYLVTDSAGIPYFQPLFQDPNTGLAPFKTFSTKVQVQLGNSPPNFFVAITDLLLGKFIADTSSLRIVNPNSPASGTTQIPLTPLTYLDPGLVTCGYEYVLSGNMQFFLTNVWSATPNSQSVSALPTTTVNSFYVFPISGLIDQQGKPASSDIYTVIYNDVLGITPSSFLFTDTQAYHIGLAEPFQFCPDSKCGPGCFGLCGGKYQGCDRNKDLTFSCATSVSAVCKFLATLPFVGLTLLCLIIFLVLLFKSKDHITGRYAPTRNTKIGMSVLVMIPSLACIAMLIILTANTNASNHYIHLMCRSI